jgi:hypothetical protein
MEVNYYKRSNCQGKQAGSGGAAATSKGYANLSRIAAFVRERSGSGTFASMGRQTSLLLVVALALVSAGCNAGAAANPVASRAAKPLDATPGFVIVGATVFDGDHFRQGNVHVRGATIAGFVDAPPPAAEVIDAKGRAVASRRE